MPSDEPLYYITFEQRNLMEEKKMSGSIDCRHSILSLCLFQISPEPAKNQGTEYEMVQQMVSQPNLKSTSRILRFHEKQTLTFPPSDPLLRIWKAIIRFSKSLSREDLGFWKLP